MIIEQKQYPLMSEGQHAVTITEVKDLGEQDTPFGKKHQMFVVFQNAAGESTRKYYTVSVHDKATLTKDVKAFTGAPPKPPFDTDSLVGRNLQIIVTHEENTKGTLRAKIAAFLKPALGQKAVAAVSAPVTVAADNLTDAAIA